MLTPLLCAVVAGALSLFKRHWGDDASDILTRFLGWFVCGLIGGWLLAIAIGWSIIPGYRSRTTQLIAFRDGQSVHGDFFLGCGTVDGVDAYFYYYQEGKGIKRGRVVESGGDNSANSMDVTIFEDTKSDGYLVIKWQESGDDTMWGLSSNADCRRHAEFHVPKGTVVRQFRADLGSGGGK